MKKKYTFPRIVFVLLIGYLNFCNLSLGNVCFSNLAHGNSLNLTTGTLIPNGKATPPFSLIDSNHQPFTERSLQNHWTLLFFGYTDCRDICPRTLAIVAKIFTLLNNPVKEKTLEFVFVSLDPKRDLPARLKTFLTQYNPNFKGLTGEETTILTLGKQWGIYSLEEPTVHGTPRKIDHSGTLLLINPRGQLQAIFNPPHNASSIAKDLEWIIHNFIHRFSG